MRASTEAGSKEKVVLLPARGKSPFKRAPQGAHYKMNGFLWLAGEAIFFLLQV